MRGSAVTSTTFGLLHSTVRGVAGHAHRGAGSANDDGLNFMLLRSGVRGYSGGCETGQGKNENREANEGALHLSNVS